MLVCKVPQICGLLISIPNLLAIVSTRNSRGTNESKMADDELEKLRSQRMAELRSQLQVCSHLGLLATSINVTLCAHSGHNPCPVHSASGWGGERGRRKGEGGGHAQVSHRAVHWRMHPLRVATLRTAGNAI